MVQENPGLDPRLLLLGILADSAARRLAGLSLRRQARAGLLHVRMLTADAAHAPGGKDRLPLPADAAGLGWDLSGEYSLG